MSASAFRISYTSALREYLADPTEASLRVAYELARDAVSRHLSVLDLAMAHQEALQSELAGAPDAAAVDRVARVAGDFFLEGLSTFEMIQRGFWEAREAALSERRQIERARRLSTFLADASLALDAHGSLEEVLRLVAEQARELVGAACCVVTVAAEGRPRAAEASSFADADRRWSAFVRWLDLQAIYGTVLEHGGSVRLTEERLGDLAPFGGAAPRDRPVHGWLAALLTALDGRALGAVQLFDKADGSFTVDDEAALVHLAQMTSAAVERALHYQARS